MSEPVHEGIAIIGLHGRFPGADSVEAFWANLLAGRETISFFTDAELAAGGHDPTALRQSGAYVPARGVLKEAEYFDAAFFGIHPKEAEVMDPQHRVFLEVCWEALERAGYAPGRIAGAVGVFAGVTTNTYYRHVLQPRPELCELIGSEQVMLGNEKDYLATRVAYKLNLNGPAISLNTACSSSLVAVSQACQSLLTYQSDLALAGGVSVRVPQYEGYLFQDGNISSPDGHTRTFDAAAKGTTFSNGVTLVVLKRLAEAVADGDEIYAVIKGTALNNDGAQRVSFGAPGVDGQSDVIAMAQEVAGIDPDTISYIEAHGTATPIGDPIEVAALTKAFRRATQRKQFCALGSVKSNIGHLDAAAGTAGLIKTALALRHGVLPPSLHFERPNPKLDLENSPFFINSTLRDWRPENGTPRRAGVSSFGTGGTNAHLVLEEAPPLTPGGPSRSWQLLALSAKTPEALEAATRNLAAHLRAHPDTPLADVAYTLQVGRTEFTHRRVVLCQSVAEAVTLLEKPEGRKVLSGRQELREPPVVFMFPGQGAQYVNMGADLHRTEPVFREAVDECARILQPILGRDLRTVLFSTAGSEAAAEEQLRQTRFTQPAIFVVEYAMARLWMSWGLKPAAMIGHSVGEYVAACLAGVFSLEDALMLVARRAELVQAQPPGSMLAVRLPEAELAPWLPPGLSIAAINSPNLCVVSGPGEAVAELEKQLTAQGVAAKALPTSHAFHSAMMDPVVKPFTALLRQVRLSAPQIPYVSNVTARWVTESEATDPVYWAGHVRQPVRFAEGAAELLKDPRRILLEVGPGQTLFQLVRQHPARHDEQPVIATSGSARDQELSNLLAALGRLWLAGATPDWKTYYQHEHRRRVVLPTYPFERKRFWPDTPVTLSLAAAASTQPTLAVGTASPGPAAIGTVAAADSPAAGPVSRAEHLAGLVRTLVEELSGTKLESAGADPSFLEMGLDSLLLTQAATLVQRRFRVPVSFRQLMEDLSSIGSLAAHLDAQLPAGAFAPAGTEATARGETAAANAIAAEQGQPVQRVYKAHGPFKPADRGSAGGLTDAQQQWLDALIARYTKRTAGSKRLAQQNRRVLADPRTASGFKQLWKEMVYPIHSARSDGARIWDVDGNEYIDFVMGFGASLFGHRAPFVVEAVQRQLGLGFEIGPIQPIVGEAAALFCQMTGMERAAFCNTGSEAMLAAIRLCRTVTGRDKIAMFSGAYHGIFDEVLTRPLKVNGEIRAAPIAPGIPDSATSQAMVFEWGNPESLELIRRCGHELAAVMVEPIQSRRLDFQPREFLHELRRITQETGTPLLFDEVVTGFRVAPGGAQAYYGIKADIAAYGKVVGGGLPIGVVAGQARLLDALDGGAWQFGDASFPEVGVTFFAGTFVRHPLTIAVAKAVLEHLHREGPALQQRVAELATRAAEALRGVIKRHRAPYHVAQFSSMMYLTPQPECKHAGLLFYLLRERGIHIFENRAFVFTTAHTDKDVARLRQACDESLALLQSAGFLDAGGAKPAPAWTGPLPLSEAQRELWLAILMNKEAALSYNITFLIRLEGALDRAALERSLQDWIDRHDSLRTSFELEEPVQHIQPKLALELGFTDLTGLPDETREAELQQRAHAQGGTSLDLTRAPLSRIQLVRLREDSHVLVLTVSHLIVDGWSVGVLLHELKSLYAAQARGRPPDLEPALQFAEYRQVLKSVEYEAAAARSEVFWRRQFASIPPELELPVDRPRPAQRSYRAARFSVQWTPEFYQALKKSSARQGATLLNYLLAGFKVLLHRLNGQEDLVVGIPAAGQIAGALQEVKGARALVGHCVNLLPVRSTCRDDQPFADYLKGLKGTMLDAYEHQELTFGRLIQLLNFTRDPARVPLVPVTFNVDRASSGLEIGGLAARVDELPRAALVFDLSVNVVDNDRDLVVHCDFNTDLFDRATIERWLGHYHRLLEGVMADPGGLVGRLPLLTEAERHRILKEWNATAVDYPRDVCLHQLFEAQAARTPDAPAVRFENHQLTYRELDRRANQLAHFLRQRGVPPGGLVGICVERSLEMVVGLLGILKAGGAYVPLDPSYPADRLAFMLKDASTSVLLTQQHLLRVLPPHDSRTICLDREWNLIARESTAQPPACTDAGALAYMIYTSGSTGRPKGAMNTHRGIVNRLRWMQDEYQLTAADAVMQKTPFSFDVSVWEFFWPLLAGARLVVAAPGGHQDTAYLINLIGAQNITVMHFVPSMLRAFLDDAGAGKCVSLREVICSGEALPHDLQEAFYARLPARLENLYGPTEAAVDVTYWACPRQDDRRIVPIGRPVANTQTYILDANLQPLPVGLPGELHLGGVQVGRGYHNRPELTAEKFIPDPFSPDPAARLYKTGDRARYLADGNIEYLGRLDHQVKMRGFRIELGEIEAVLGQHRAVREVVVVAREDIPGNKRLAAYLVTSSPAPEPAGLRDHLRKQLPEYMVPSVIIFLPKLPLTNSGKIDRNALPRPGQDRAELAAAYTAPSNDAEANLAEVWSQVLQLKQVGIHDNFFELGGHSLLALRVVSRLRQQLGIEVPLSTVFDTPTVAGMAARLTELQAASLDSDELAGLLDEIESGPPAGGPGARPAPKPNS